MYNEEDLFDGRRRGRMAQRGWHGRGGPGGHRRGGRMRRGEIRTALLAHTRRRARSRLRGDAAARGAAAAAPGGRAPAPSIPPCSIAGRRARHLDRAGRQARSSRSPKRAGPSSPNGPRSCRSGAPGRTTSLVRVRATPRRRDRASCQASRQIAEVGQRGADPTRGRDRARRAQAALPAPRRGLSSRALCQRASSSASNFLGATSRYASSMMPATSSQSGSRSSRTPSQPRPPT